MRILLIGKNGQVGWELQRSLAPLGDITAVDYPETDLADADSIVSTIHTCRPHLVVNAAGYTDVDRAEGEPDRAMALNGTAPGIIAEEMRRSGGVVVHYSTDYVFDGSKDGPYVETDIPQPLSAYGRSKLAGEEAIRAAGVDHLIVRSSWLYGSRGGNFLLTMLDLARRKEKIRVVEDQVGAPTWCRFLAEATARMLAVVDIKNAEDRLSRLSGTCHLTAAGATSWYEFAKLILELDPRKDEHRLREITPVSTKEYNSPASRPRNCRLDCSKAEHTFDIKRPPWQESLRKVMGELQGSGA